MGEGRGVKGSCALRTLNSGPVGGHCWETLPSHCQFTKDGVDPQCPKSLSVTLFVPLWPRPLFLLILQFHFAKSQAYLVPLHLEASGPNWGLSAWCVKPSKHTRGLASEGHDVTQIEGRLHVVESIPGAPFLKGTVQQPKIIFKEFPSLLPLSRAVRGDAVLTPQSHSVSPFVPFPFSPSTLGGSLCPRSLTPASLLLPPPHPSSHRGACDLLLRLPCLVPKEEKPGTDQGKALMLLVPCGSPVHPPGLHPIATELGEGRHVADQAQEKKKKKSLVQSVGTWGAPKCW